VKKPLTAETAEFAEKKTLRILGVLCVLCGKTVLCFTRSKVCATVLRYGLILVAQVFRPARRSQQQRLDAMRVDPCLTGRPCEDGEMAILRRHQRDAVALILNELRRREVPGSAKG